jgi:hypothetical protein
MHFALPSYQFPYIVMNECFYPKFQNIMFHLSDPIRLFVKTSGFGRVWSPLEQELGSELVLNLAI